MVVAKDNSTQQSLKRGAEQRERGCSEAKSSEKSDMDRHHHGKTGFLPPRLNHLLRHLSPRSKLLTWNCPTGEFALL